MPPVRYTPSVDTVEPDEAATIDGLIDAELTVLDGLPPELAQGLFARAGTYAAHVRISTSPGDLMDDHVSTPRGIALKIHGVPGEERGARLGCPFHEGARHAAG